MPPFPRLLLLYFGVLAVVAAFLAWPLSRAFLAGVSAARDPNVRVTFLHPWQCFWFTFRRKYRYWILLWPSAYVGLIALGGTIWEVWEYLFWPQKLLLSATLLVVIIGLWLLLLAFCFLGAPRFRRHKSLSLVATIFAVFCYTSSVAFILALAPRPIIMTRFKQIDGAHDLKQASGGVSLSQAKESWESWITQGGIAHAARFLIVMPIHSDRDRRSGATIIHGPLYLWPFYSAGLCFIILGLAWLWAYYPIQGGVRWFVFKE